MGERRPFSRFIDGLGPGQLIARQALGTISRGEIQMCICYKDGLFHIEVVKAKGLMPKPGARRIPAPYVKVYLLNGTKRIGKLRTFTARRTLTPWYQQLMYMTKNPAGCILQVTVYGDYGFLKGRKVFMGTAQIVLDELNLQNLVIGWYKLFDEDSLVNGPPYLGIIRRPSVSSEECEEEEKRF